MRHFCSRAIPYLMVGASMVELDRVLDLQTLQVPMALVIALCAVGMLLPQRRSV